MSDIASLVLKIDSTQVESGAKSLDKLSQSGQGASSSSDRLATAARKVAEAITQQTQSVDKSTDAIKKNSEAADTNAERIVTMVKSIGAIVTTAIAAAGALYKIAHASIEAADKMNNLQLRTGLTFKELAAFDLLAKTSGTTVEAVAHGFMFLGKEISTHGDKLKILGVTSKDSFTAMGQLADLIKNIKDPMLAASVATAVLSRSGEQLIPMLKGGSAAMHEALGDTAKYGELLGQLAPKAVAYNESVAKLAIHSKETGINIAIHVLPVLNAIVKVMADISAGGAKAKDAFNWMSEKSPLMAGLVRMHYWLEKIVALNSKLGVRQEGPVKPIRGSETDRAAKAEEELALGEKNELVILSQRAAEAFLAKKNSADKYASTLHSLEARVKSYAAQLREQVDVEHKLTETEKLALVVKEKLTSADQKRFAPILAQMRLDEEVIKQRTEQEKLDKKRAAGLLEITAIEERLALTNKTKLEELQDELKFYGEDSRSRQRRITLLHMETEAEQAAIRIRKEGKDSKQEDGGEAAAQALIEAAKKTREAWAQTYDAITEKHRSWEAGVVRALKKYMDESQNAGDIAEKAVTSGLKTMEDMLVEFTTKGKINFRSLGDSFVAEINRMIIKQLALNALQKMGGPGGILGSVMGFFGGSAGATPAEETAAMSAWAAVPAYADGTDFVPRDGYAFLHRGESVKTAKETATAANDRKIDQRPIQVSNHFTLSAPADLRTQQQIAASAGLGVRRALARNT